MGLTVTSSGYNYRTLLARADAEGRRLVQQMEAEAVNAITAQTPVAQSMRDPGMIATHLKKSTSHYGFGEARIHMGELKPLDIDKPAPRHTIRDFLRTYYGRKLKRKKHPFPHAWYFLAVDQKIRLDQARRTAQFGGPLPPPKMMEAINSGAILKTVPQRHSDYGYYSAARGFIGRIKASVLVAWLREIGSVRL